MAFCENCGQQHDDSAKFCPNCGAKTDKNDTENKSQRQTVYSGEIHKCPNCGEVLNSFLINCPACGYELRSTKASNAVREFVLKLEAIESSREQEKPKNVFTRNLKTDKITKTDEQKINLIRNYFIPNTKEDIIEFLILASSNIDFKLYGDNTSGIQREISDAWLAKFDQAYQKAKLTFGKNPDFQYMKNIFNETHRKINKVKRNYVLLIIISILGTLLFFFIMFLLLDQ